MVKAIILSAGEGTRLSPLTDTCPKSMLEICGKPVLEYIINSLRLSGIQEIAINVHSNYRKIIDYFGDGRDWNVRIQYSIEQELSGTAGALNSFLDFFDDTFVVWYGDVLSKVDITKILAFHKEMNGIATIGLYKVNNPTECGIVGLNDNHKITRFHEKPEPHEVFSDWANAGIYVMESSILPYIPEHEIYDFGKDLFPKILREREALYGFQIADYLIDIGTKEKYAKAQSDFTLESEIL
jgi:mannose-1-phosphate guanylyltransferase